MRDEDQWSDQSCRGYSPQGPPARRGLFFWLARSPRFVRLTFFALACCFALAALADILLALLDPERPMRVASMILGGLLRAFGFVFGLGG